MLKESLRYMPGMGLLFLLLIILSSTGAATSSGSNASSTGSSSSLSGDTFVAPSNRASDIGATSRFLQRAQFGSVPCDVGTKQNWDAFLHTQQGINMVESVTCVHLKGDASTQALVLVRNDGTGHILNVYIYDVTTVSTHMARQLLFKLEGLYKGSAKISSVNTLITGEADLTSRANQHIPNASIAPDIYREFKWSASRHAFLQMLFPGIFPDLTRYQAEADQEQVAVEGHQPWKQDAILTAQAFVNGLANVNNAPTTTSTQATLISGSNKGVDAVVKVRSSHFSSNSILVTMSRLNRYSNGIWIITGVQTYGMSIDSPAALTAHTSPILVKGQANAFEGVVGELVVQDRTDSSIGIIGRVSAHVAPGANGMGQSRFTSSVPYSFSSQKSGISAEEATLALYARSEADGSISGAYVIKVLLS